MVLLHKIINYHVQFLYVVGQNIWQAKDNRSILGSINKGQSIHRTLSERENMKYTIKPLYYIKIHKITGIVCKLSEAL